MSEFEKQFYRFMLHREVMVLAVTRIEGTWKAYSFPVPGKNHDDEQALWKEEGTQLPEHIARSIFGHLENMPYAS